MGIDVGMDAYADDVGIDVCAYAADLVLSPSLRSCQPTPVIDLDLPVPSLAQLANVNDTSVYSVVMSTIGNNSRHWNQIAIHFRQQLKVYVDVEVAEQLLNLRGYTEFVIIGGFLPPYSVVVHAYHKCTKVSQLPGSAGNCASW